MLIAFDIFGTIFDLNDVPREEKVEYLRHIKQETWMPLKLPKTWELLNAHPDSAYCLSKLREHHTVVTLSNGPLGLQTKLSKRNGISWDAITPLEMRRVFKPQLTAYRMLSEVYDFPPEEIMMVTANKTFGDLEAAERVGIQSQLIRDVEGGGLTFFDFVKKMCPHDDAFLAQQSAQN